MQNEALSKKALTSLLKEAEKAHTEYEYALGHRDDDCATWYAWFIIDRLREDSDMASSDEGTQLAKEVIDGQPDETTLL